MDLLDVGKCESICGVPLDEAVRVLTIYRMCPMYDIEDKSFKGFISGYTDGYNQAVHDMKVSIDIAIERSVRFNDGYKSGTMSNLPPMPQKTENA